MSCPGLHCPGCGDGGKLSAIVGLALLAAVCAVLDRILHVLEDALVITGIVAACGILSIAAVAILGVVRRLRSEHLMSVASIGPPSREAVTATVIPQVTEGTTPLAAIENHYHIHFDPADREAARLIRSALPGAAGEIFTEE
jgi:hypothetical protein